MFIFGGGSSTSQYRVTRSLRFKSATPTYLTRTNGTTGTSTTIGTVSFWVKRCVFGTAQDVINFGSGSPRAQMGFDTSDRFFVQDTGGSGPIRTTTRVFRDPSAWMHILVCWSTSLGTAADRLQVWINGVRETVFTSSTDPTSAQAIGFGGTNAAYMGTFNAGSQNSANFYLAEVYQIDGQALDSSSFTQTNSTTNQLEPKTYTGTYGTNGYKLTFSDNSNTTAATLGADTSGNGNNWTPSGFSVTAGVTNDSLTDTPTSYGTDTGLGGEVRGNYTTLNPLDNGGATLGNCNLSLSVANGIWRSVRSTIAIPSTGIWVAEYTVGTSNGGNTSMIGVCTQNAALTNYVGAAAEGWGYYDSGNKFNNNSSTSYGSSYTNGAKLIVAFNANVGALWFGQISGGTITWQNSATAAEIAAGTTTHAAFTGLTGGPYFFTSGANGMDNHYANFGQRAWEGVTNFPSGAKALCTQNLSTPTIVKPAQYFDVNTRTGTGAAFNVVGKFFQPDFIWNKVRSTTGNHVLSDSTRGTGKYYSSNASTAETSDAQAITAFNTDGFSGGTAAVLNTNTATYVDWFWKKGATPGFDIVGYTGTGANRTVSHALGVAPSLIITKRRSGAEEPVVWHSSFVTASNTDYLLLDSTGAKGASGSINFWNATAPTSSVFSLGSATAVNNNTDTYIAYLFSEVAGFSKFGTYTGNGSADGPFVYCGFRPRWVLIKKSSASGDNWALVDATRDSFNSSTFSTNLFPNTSDADDTANKYLDIVSNGFKLRGASGGVNGSSATYIFAAFAEYPFIYARAR